MSFLLLNQYELGNKLEDGAEGEVFKAKRCYDHSTVAIKLANWKANGKSRLPTEIYNNILLKDSKIQGVVRMLDFEVMKDETKTFGEYAMVMEYVPVDLYHFWFSYTSVKKDEEMCKMIMRQVVHAAYQMQKILSLSHMDIKAENVLIDPTTLKVKLCDFSKCARRHGWTDNRNAGTVNYWAPECVMYNKFHFEKSIVWTIGILCYCLLHDMSYPWEKFSRSKYEKLAISKKISRKGTDFVLNCLTINWEERPNLKQVLEMDWLSY